MLRQTKDQGNTVNSPTAPVKIAFILVIIACISLFIFMRLVFPKQCNSALQLYSLLESCCHVSFTPWREGKDKRIKRCRIKGELVTHMHANCFCVALIYEAYHVLFMVPQTRTQREAVTSELVQRCLFVALALHYRTYDV